MAEDFDVVVAGHICLDIIPQIADEQLKFIPGRLFEIGPAVLSTGGPVSNTGLALHKLGVGTRLMGKIGRDAFGGIVRSIVAGFGPDLAEGMIEVAGETTSYTVIISPRGTDRMFLHCTGCNDTFVASDVDYPMVGRARLFHFGYPPLLKSVIANDGAELIAVFEHAKQAGATTSLDMSMPDPNSFSGRVDWAAILGRTLPNVDIFLPSFEETLFTLFPAEFRRIMDDAGGETAPDPDLVSRIGKHLLGMGPSVVGLKLGPHGFYLTTAESSRWVRFGRALPPDPAGWASRELWSPCFEAQVAGTTGSGDATIAGFLAAMLRGAAPEECLTLACAVGGCNVEAPDALSGLRSWEDTKARVNRGWDRKRVPLAGPAWSVLPSGVWRSATDGDAGRTTTTSN
jgi:sugar/nucleoside kinase (ribokinase family)